MKFVDFIRVQVSGGRKATVPSFRREKFVPKGGPDGADGAGRRRDPRGGGRGSTLADFEEKNSPAVGGHGKGKLKTGAAGTDKIIQVPCGTIVYDDDTGRSWQIL